MLHSWYNWALGLGNKILHMYITQLRARTCWQTVLLDSRKSEEGIITQLHLRPPFLEIFIKKKKKRQQKVILNVQQLWWLSQQGRLLPPLQSPCARRAKTPMSITDCSCRQVIVMRVPSKCKAALSSSDPVCFANPFLKYSTQQHAFL